MDERLICPVCRVRRAHTAGRCDLCQETAKIQLRGIKDAAGRPVRPSPVIPLVYRQTPPAAVVDAALSEWIAQQEARG